jgi:hypothetical protein
MKPTCFPYEDMTETELELEQRWFYRPAWIKGVPWAIQKRRIAQAFESTALVFRTCWETRSMTGKPRWTLFFTLPCMFLRSCRIAKRMYVP